jgi:serine/threonine protein kinase
LRHPNIVQVIDFDVQDDEYYMVMEYIETETLKSRLQKHGALPVREALVIARKLADALAYAHAHGMLHRDVKPANVLMSKTGEPILTDFGIAKLMDASGLTASGAAVGTPAYMSPEAGRGDPVDERTDIYSLGVMLYEMLSGQLPFDADTPYAVILKHINEPPPPLGQRVPHLPESVEHIVIRALAKDKAQRYQSAAEMRDALLKAEQALPDAHATVELSPARAKDDHRLVVLSTLCAVADRRQHGHPDRRVVGHQHHQHGRAAWTAARRFSVSHSHCNEHCHADGHRHSDAYIHANCH